MSWDKKIATGIAVVGAIGVKLLGGWDVLVYMLCIAMLLDYVTGVILALKNRKLSSSVGIDGILKKVMILCMVALAVVVDSVAGNTGAIRALVIMFYVGMEGISILENAVGAGLSVPDKLREALAQLKENGKKAEPTIIKTINQATTETIDGVTTESVKETITATTSKEE